MPDRLETLIDHAAELQQQVDRLGEEVIALALVAIALAGLVAVMGWRLWRP